MSFGDLLLKQDLQTVLGKGQGIEILEFWVGSPLLELPFDPDLSNKVQS